MNDNIYVTGNLGDSYAGLNILKNKYNIKKSLKKYFVNTYYQPNVHLNLAKKLFLFANTSIDISDGLIDDLEKLINKQNLSYKLNLHNVPISNNLKKLLILKNYIKSPSYLGEMIIKYCLQLIHLNLESLSKIAKSLRIKISKIGKITSGAHKSQILDQKGMKIGLKEKGYTHKF